jgi:hypothetical protein
MVYVWQFNPLSLLRQQRHSEAAVNTHSFPPGTDVRAYMPMGPIEIWNPGYHHPAAAVSVAQKAEAWPEELGEGCAARAALIACRPIPDRECCGILPPSSGLSATTWKPTQLRFTIRVLARCL